MTHTPNEPGSYPENSLGGTPRGDTPYPSASQPPASQELPDANPVSVPGPSQHPNFFPASDANGLTEPQPYLAGQQIHADPVAPAPKNRNGSGLMVGLAIGALVGGIVGGGVAAIIGDNSSSNMTTTQAPSTITITNPENATAVSAIAAVGAPSVVTLDVMSNTGSGTGSGIIYSEDGYIITNAHVVTMPNSSLADTVIRVILSDGSMLNGTVVGTAPYADIAVVKVEAEGLSAIETADSAEVTVGDIAVAIGAPFDLSGTVTSGIVSSLNRGISVGSPLIPLDEGTEESEPSNPWDFEFDMPGQQQESPQAGGQVTLPVIQTDADINPGNSGGALLNGNGELIGVNVAIASTGVSTDETQGSVGLGFAIPANLATRVADAIIAGETPTHGLLGATVGDARMSDQATQQGGLVNSVLPDGAAAAAGIRAGDIIVSVDGVPAPDGTTVSALIRYHAGDSTVDLGIVRGGELTTQSVTLGTLES